MTETLPEVDWRDRYQWQTSDTWLINTVKFIVGVGLQTFIKIECHGFEHIPPTGGCVMASNHISNFDPPVLGTSLPRYPHFMAKRALFKHPLSRWFCREGGSFPVHRGERDDWAMRQAGRVLDAGSVLFIFPEGTRSRDMGRLQKAKTGAIRFGIDYQVPIIPVAIMGSHAVKFKLGQRHKISLTIGEPLDLIALAGQPPYDSKTIKMLTTILMERIAAMLPPDKRGYYA